MMRARSEKGADWVTRPPAGRRINVVRWRAGYD